jgi:apolipoprotein N-acyltransferase
MAKKNSVTWNPWGLLALSLVLLMAGWLMKSFPVLIFVGVAPLFAISDHANTSKNPWNRFELILLALAVAFFAATLFDFHLLVLVLAQAIVLTLAFVGYSFAYQNLGSRLGKFTIIFFWLGLEYLFLALPWREQTIFLADALSLYENSTQWTHYVGYLGISLWILVVNLVFYLSFFQTKTFRVYLFILAIVLIIIPPLLSYQLETPGVNRLQMISFYTSESNILDAQNLKQGELVAKTSAWVSVLVVLLSFVKYQTQKK